MCTGHHFLSSTEGSYSNSLFSLLHHQNLPLRWMFPINPQNMLQCISFWNTKKIVEKPSFNYHLISLLDFLCIPEKIAYIHSLPFTHFILSWTHSKQAFFLTILFKQLASRSQVIFILPNPWSITNLHTTQLAAAFDPMIPFWDALFSWLPRTPLSLFFVLLASHSSNSPTSECWTASGSVSCVYSFLSMLIL